MYRPQIWPYLKSGGVFTTVPVLTANGKMRGTALLHSPPHEGKSIGSGSAQQVETGKPSRHTLSLATIKFLKTMGRHQVFTKPNQMDLQFFAYNRHARFFRKGTEKGILSLRQ